MNIKTYIITCLIAGLYLAGLVKCTQGALYETPEQFEPGKATLTQDNGGSVVLEWHGAHLFHKGLFVQDEGPDQQKELQCIVESFEYDDHREITFAMIRKFLTPYLESGKELSVLTVDGQRTDEQFWLITEGPDQTPYAAVHYLNKKHVLEVATYAVFQQLRAVKAQEREQQQQGAKEEDCVIQAQVKRLALEKAGNYWQKVFAFNHTWNGKTEGTGRGHAMTAYKFKAEGNVYLYDQANGSIELPTTKEDAHEIARAFERLYQKAKVNLKVTDERFLE